MITLAQMLRLTDPSRPRGAGVTDAPYVVDLDGSPWTVATDAKGALWVHGSIAGATPASGRSSERLRTIATPRGEPRPVNLAALKTWCGAPVWSEPCPKCKGTSALSEHVTCTFCEDDGTVGTAPRPGVLHGLGIDRSVLARYLDAVDGEAVLHCGRSDAPLWIVGDGWRVALMPMSSEPEAGAPVFPVEPAAAGAPS